MMTRLLRENVYFGIFFPHTRPKRCACFDRNYNYMGEMPELWEKIKISEWVEYDPKGFRPTFQTPQWVSKLVDLGEHYVSFWTDYYEGR